MLKLLLEGDKMKEKIQQYKWIIIIACILILNIGWMIYDRQQVNDGILIEENTNTKVEQPTPYELGQAKEIDEEENTAKLEAVTKSEQVQKVPIYICGEVLNPGVYYVASDAIINDVIICSGGLTPDADHTAINLASPIQPNEKIIVPKQGEEIDKSVDSYENRERIETVPSSQLTSQPSPNTSSASQNELININTATKEELMTLNGIGEAKAAAIIAYRQENGGFKSIDEMMQISGIGEKTFDKIKQFITT